MEPLVSRPKRREFDRLSQCDGPEIRVATAEEIPFLHEFAKLQIPDVQAFESTLRRVHQRNSNSLLVITENERFLGGVGFLFLNEAGRDALLKGELDFQNPQDECLCKEEDAPAAIYVWANYAKGRAIRVTWKVMEWLRQEGRAQADLYARPNTFEGVRFVKNGGFKPIASSRHELWRYERATSINEDPIRRET
jgi:hypothetical protein